MSNPNEPGPAPDATTGQDSKDGAGEAAKRTETSAYQAPYHPYEKSRVPGEYLVAFRPGYTLTEHFKFLGREFELITPFNSGYAAALDDLLFDAVRRDPGVEFMEDNVSGEWED